jgi:hypothetical protein
LFGKIINEVVRTYGLSARKLSDRFLFNTWPVNDVDEAASRLWRHAGRRIIAEPLTPFSPQERTSFVLNWLGSDTFAINRCCSASLTSPEVSPKSLFDNTQLVTTSRNKS